MISCKRALVLFSLMIALGCGGKSDQPKSATVKGKVKLDGTDLPSGKILFDEGQGIPAVELEIKDGTYSGSVTVGKKTIRITAMRMAKAPPGMSGMPGYEKGIEENYLPSKYNTASTDVREVKEGVENTFDFNVTKK